jgi:hypothetical protein
MVVQSTATERDHQWEQHHGDEFYWPTPLQRAWLPELRNVPAPASQCRRELLGRVNNHLLGRTGLTDLQGGQFEIESWSSGCEAGKSPHLAHFPSDSSIENIS